MHRKAAHTVAGVVAVAMAATGAGIGQAAAANRQDPQEVTGPCHVEGFFIVPLGTTNTDLVLANSGQACAFTIFNPGLDRISNAAIVTTPAQHGVAQAELINGRIQVGVSYTPQPGFIGRDAFTVTIEPNNKALLVHVDSRPAGSKLD